MSALPLAVMMLEAEGVYRPNEAEGESGLEVRRALLGMRWAPAPWAEVVSTINAVAVKPVPLLWDAHVILSHRSGLKAEVGHGQTPLFPSVQQPRDTHPIPELSLTTAAFWPGRDTGLQLQLTNPHLPVEAWLRVGNGSGSPSGNDNPHLSADGRLDLVAGRARAPQGRATPLGLRLGVGGHTEDAEDRAGITGTLPTGFVFWRAPTIHGPVQIAEGHLVALAGPLQLTAEGALAQESRARDTDGNPTTPREDLDAVRSQGGCLEVAWMLTGQQRLPGAWPLAGEAPGLELSVRVERLSLGQGAEDVAPSGATSAEGALHLWLPEGIGAALWGGAARYDAAPLETPNSTSSWFLAARLSARWL